MKTTEEDYNMIKYFWEEKGDITRWANWEKRKNVIFFNHPELAYAMDDYDKALKFMNLVVKMLGE